MPKYTSSPQNQGSSLQLRQAEEDLANFIFGCPDTCKILHVHEKGFYDDPLGFVMGAYPWGEPGALQAYDGPDTWQKELLIQLGEEIRKRKFNGVDAVDPIRITRASGHGAGKLHPNSMVLLTPDGYKKWGDLKVGDKVYAEDGSPTKITHVHPQGKKKIYRVTFDDDSTCDVGAEHLWKVKGRNQRRRGLDWVILSTKELMDRGVNRLNGISTSRKWEIPIQGGAQIDSIDIPIHPYTLGVWLGDGHSWGGTITNIDYDLIDRLREVGEVVNPNKDQAWGIQGLGPEIKGLGLYRIPVDKKHVPEIYKRNSIEVREEVLRGLLDTDGECGKHGTIIFNSVSKQLALDVIWLVRSLGGKAQLQPTPKKGIYKNRDGDEVICRDCYRVTVCMPHNFLCFYIKRKQERVRNVQDRYLKRWISKIELIGRMESQCVTIEHPSHCYLANDFIVTHNSVLAAMITDYIMSTRINSIGTVTANTYGQLETKTWAAIQKWTRMCITSHWFEVTGSIMFKKDTREQWFTAALSCAEENAQAFAGQHNANSTSFYIFDEGSTVPDAIYNVADGGLTDGEPMMFVFGNPTRRTGKLYNINFGNERKYWNYKSIDSRKCKYTNPRLLQEWLEMWGEDSDRYRVQVKGLPPTASDLQYISTSLVGEAQRRQVTVLRNDPIICGLDVSRGGADNCVFRFRRGNDARSIPTIRISGEDARNSIVLENIALDLLRNGVPIPEQVRDTLFGVTEGYGNGERRLPLTMMFIDGTGVGGPICDHIKNLGFEKQVTEIQFAWEAPNTSGVESCANQRAWMWALMKKWLEKGGIDDSSDLESDLTRPMYHFNSKNELVLESKEAMKKRCGTIEHSGSPDDGDALALTFARPVAPRKKNKIEDEEEYEGESEFQEHENAPVKATGWS